MSLSRTTQTASKTVRSSGSSTPRRCSIGGRSWRLRVSCAGVRRGHPDAPHRAIADRFGGARRRAGGTRVDVRRCFEEHRARVYRWAFAMCRRHDDALDVVQEVFMRLLRRPPQNASPEQIRAWLRRTTRSVVVDRWRRVRKRPKENADLALVDEAFTAKRAPDARETDAEIREALAALSEQQQLVVLAKVCDEMTFRAIAAELGIAESTAKTHYLRGLRALRDRLSASLGIGSRS
ncbi:MAG: sigma-70 family RNA polymerase sigma factor [Planctomycetota bacterium]|nr:MAG: sigma-70 family RNA polymerase sigma factor [Planctomycetota bacterium]